MVSLEVFAFLLSGISISASLFYYANVLQNANRTRQTQLFMQIYDRFDDKEFMKTLHHLLSLEWSSPEEFMDKYGPVSNLERYTISDSIF